MSFASSAAPPSVLVVATAGAIGDLEHGLRAKGFDPVFLKPSMQVGDVLDPARCDAMLIDASRRDSEVHEPSKTISRLPQWIPIVLRTTDAGQSEWERVSDGRLFASIERSDDLGPLVAALWQACWHGAARRAIELEASLRNRDVMLAQSKAEIIDFAAVCAHDLRSPLLTVSGYCDLLRHEHGDHLDESAKRYLQSICNAIPRMNRLIDDLAAYARLGNGSNGAGPLELNEVLADAVSNLDVSIRAANAIIEIDRLPSVAGNRSRLVQVFQNLLDNAIKFRGKTRPAVRISASADGEGVVVRVADNGIGIAAEHHESIFRVFHRLARSREVPGTGMGLAICRRIVESHGGRIWVESQPDRGATFFVRLPKPPSE
ncbi:MAG: GHKL domain-containing protein [Pirellulaceae bacterium]|nr:GHKL domain-containing protein [Pirellulaceae bacterium]